MGETGATARAAKLEYHLEDVFDPAGKSLPFVHRGGNLLVELPKPLEAGETVELRFKIGGDVLYHPGNDSYWRVVGAWYPVPRSLAGQAFRYHAVVRVPKPWVPFSDGVVVRRFEEDGLACAEFAEEKPMLKPLPAERFRYFRETSNTVDDSGTVQVARSYYAALPAAPADIVTVRLYDHDVEIFDGAGVLLRRHPRSYVPGHFAMEESDRIFNPSRETVRLLGRAAKLGPHSLELARDIFLRLGRTGQKALYGMTNLPRHYAKDDIENAAKRVLTLSQPTYHALKRILERQALETERRAAAPELQQTGPHIRDIEEYHRFFETAQRCFDDQPTENM